MITVISGYPPSGRCTLYTNYATEIAHLLGVGFSLRYGERRAAHGDGFPSLLIGGRAVQPRDGRLLSPDDLCEALEEAGYLVIDPEALAARLEGIQERIFFQKPREVAYRPLMRA